MTIAKRECMFCDKPTGEMKMVRDEGHFVTTGETTFEPGCEACRERFGLKTRQELAKNAWRKGWQRQRKR